MVLRSGLGNAAGSLSSRTRDFCDNTWRPPNLLGISNFQGESKKCHCASSSSQVPLLQTCSINLQKISSLPMVWVNCLYHFFLKLNDLGMCLKKERENQGDFRFMWEARKVTHNWSV